MSGEPRDPGGRDGAPPSERLTDERGLTATLAAVLHEIGEVDRAVYRAVAGTPTPILDGPMHALTRAADHSKLWFATAGVMAAVGGRTGRRAALTGLAAIGLTSAVVNLPMKVAGSRHRPDRDAAGVPASRRVEMPASSSFPSGHSASAAAFAAAVSSVVPALGAPLGCAAAAVGYSRVHAGVHYPGDVIAGTIVGAAIGEAVATAARRVRRRRRR